MKYELSSYNGNKEYIFISYAHDDKEKVFPILEQLVKNGIRIWYDTGIEWGSEYRGEIANHLINSTTVIPFISPAFVKSTNCLQEIYYALDKGKNILSIYLEETELPAGLEMSLSPYQFTNFYQYDGENDIFFNRLFNSPVVSLCRSDSVKQIDEKESDNNNQFIIIEGDLSEASADVIVSSSNSRLSMNYGVSKAISKKANSIELKKVLKEIGYCPPGNAIITDAYGLNAKKLIHAVGVNRETQNVDDTLEKAYSRILNLAYEYNLKTIALPLLSTGIVGVPFKKSYSILRKVADKFLSEHPDFKIHLYVLNKEVLK